MERLTGEERAFAESNHHIVDEFLRTRGLNKNEWYDVVIFRYLRSVSSYLTRPELHAYPFKAIAFNAMRSAVGNERKRNGRRIQAASLEAEIDGTDGLTIGDSITERNLCYTPLETETKKLQEVERIERVVQMNNLSSLNNYLFAALERVNDDALDGEALEKELKKAEASSKLAYTIIDNARLQLAAIKHRDDQGYGANGDHRKLPELLETRGDI